MNLFDNSPKKAGYRFPAEWSKHEATWLTWPHKEASWPGKIEAIYAPYCQFIKVISEGEKVRINVNDEQTREFAISKLIEQAAGRIVIMPGAGISITNIAELIKSTGAKEFHASAKIPVPGKMNFRNPDLNMGAVTDEFNYDLTDEHTVRNLIELANSAE